MVTHDPVAASYADRVVFLADGQVSGELLDPTPETVLDYLRAAAVRAVPVPCPARLARERGSEARPCCAPRSPACAPARCGWPCPRSRSRPGVGFVAGTLILGASMNQSFYDSFAAGARNVRPRSARRDASDLRPGARRTRRICRCPRWRAVRAVPGVAAADGRVVGPAALIGPDGHDRQRTTVKPGVGISVASDPALRGFTVVSGRVPRGPGEVAVDTATAADEHFRLGQRVRIVSAAGP